VSGLPRVLSCEASTEADHRAVRGASTAIMSARHGFLSSVESPDLARNEESDAPRGRSLAWPRWPNIGAGSWAMPMPATGGRGPPI